ncbi:mRNA-decapping enzyme 2, putative [Plasmodium knowlesi strain H]|uniref:mRNA-decapping enzyme 2, putative n=3 Tax=Plasmodium knowlesi TaxID=5850 RepID=A0A5K1TVL9_PLAKH|nr:mRNA-decapping enzyme 2, putative [Plasmodium knowlesi strain H]OTN64264.1 putative NUDIX hydrolase [Plasmodium knowlesi]CAA9990692.1 mRNA-decapping enzyme 2, putative [Plasmodium knowlesi strain H]SBO25914.1 mRNA-decapping enzyme 2, putative [Plasmodium knowlesi strain H]SBO28666.1 mRNA-decapping enzyme 2, putative [Plasmodium knowlesi strain H]VVS80166.1 mRNA-decapping enzyme 2, putative [Plasmodium knowlesi strain H]|eukprot:XP_002261982.1 NUDIX hydrolase, putative [Plasmodium knowlesi strain H]
MNLIKGAKNKPQKHSQNKHVNNNAKCKKIFSSHRIKQLAKDKKLLDDALLDCYGRFIALLPEFLLKDHVHLYFQIQEAYWWYDDMWQEKYPDKLPKLSLKTFGYLICDDCPILKKYVPPSAHEKFSLNWRRYCRTIPLRGAILLNHNLKKCLLVKGWSTDSWSFPKGKVDELEEDSVCACREIYEEIGIDIFPYIDEQVFIETHIEDQPIKLFIIPGVKEETKFQPKTRKEIGAIRWFEIEKLFQHINLKNKKSILFESKKERINEWFVGPFIPNLVKWIEVLKKSVPAKDLKGGNSFIPGSIQAHKYQITGLDQAVIKKLQTVNLNSKEIINIGLLKSDDDLEEYDYENVDQNMDEHVSEDVNDKLLPEDVDDEVVSKEVTTSYANYNSAINFPGVDKNRGSFTNEEGVKNSSTCSSVSNRRMEKGSIGPNRRQTSTNYYNQEMVSIKGEGTVGQGSPLYDGVNCNDSRHPLDPTVEEGAYVEESTYSRMEKELMGNKKVYEHIDDAIVPLRRKDILLSSSSHYPDRAILGELINENNSSNDVRDNYQNNAMGSTNKMISTNSSCIKSMNNEMKKGGNGGNDAHKDLYGVESYPSPIREVKNSAIKMPAKQNSFRLDHSDNKKNSISINSSGSGSYNKENSSSNNNKNRNNNNNEPYHGASSINTYKRTSHMYGNNYGKHYGEYDPAGGKGYRYSLNRMRMGGHLSALRLKEVGLRSFDDQDMEKRKNFHLQVYGKKDKLNCDKKEIQNRYKKLSLKNPYHSLDDSSVYYVPTKNRTLDACNDKTFGENRTNGWSAEDMFKLNEEKFGIHSTYNIEEYTTPLVYKEEKIGRYNKNDKMKEGMNPHMMGRSNKQVGRYNIKMGDRAERGNYIPGGRIYKSNSSSSNNNEMNENNPVEWSKGSSIHSLNDNAYINVNALLESRSNMTPNGNPRLVNDKNGKESISCVSSNMSDSSRGMGLVKSNNERVNFINGYYVHHERSVDEDPRNEIQAGISGSSHVHVINGMNGVSGMNSLSASNGKNHPRKNANGNMNSAMSHMEERGSNVNEDMIRAEMLRKYKLNEGYDIIQRGNMSQKKVNNFSDFDKSSIRYSDMKHEKNYKKDTQMNSSTNDPFSNEYILNGANRKEKVDILSGDVNYKSKSACYGANYMNTRKDNNHLVNKSNVGEYLNESILGITTDGMSGEGHPEYRSVPSRSSFGGSSNGKNKLTLSDLRINREVIDKREYSHLDGEGIGLYKIKEKEIPFSKKTSQDSNNSSTHSNEPGKYLLNLIKGTVKSDVASDPNVTNNNRNDMSRGSVMSSGSAKPLSEKEILSKFYSNETGNHAFTKNVNSAHNSMGSRRNSINNGERNDNYRNVIPKDNLNMQKNRNRMNVEHDTYDDTNRHDTQEESKFNEMEMMEKLSKHLNSYNPFE